MKISRSDIFEALSFALFCIIILLIVVVMLPFMPFIWLAERRRMATFQKGYHAFLHQINGHMIFCYNSRTNSSGFVKEKILPLLPPGVHIVYLNGGVPESDYESVYISNVIHSLAGQGGFPYLLKVRDGQLYHHSVNTQVYSMIHKNKISDQHMSEILDYYKA
ncbi:MAG: hypothetical protein JST90_00535 [Bacteroidetes bacterium]|nr:hypothetical protein [Bacteroidota bacterium]